MVGCGRNYRQIPDTESEAAPHYRAHVAGIGRIDEDHVIAFQDMFFPLFDDTDDEAVLFL